MHCSTFPRENPAIVRGISRLDTDYRTPTEVLARSPQLADPFACHRCGVIDKWLKHDLVTARTLNRQSCDTLAAGAAQFGYLRGLSAASGDKVAIEGILLQLLKCAHPDRWCQGQLMTEPAHELTVAINAVRARLGGGA